MDWIEDIPSAWTGHRTFAEWLVKRARPSVTVELGVDHGYSLFCFAKALKDNDVEGRIYGIDAFAGDAHAGYRNTLEQVNSLLSKKELENHSEVIISSFDDAYATWGKPIDILHIDGLHTYETSKNDLVKWQKFVKDDGIILMHDGVAKHFGVYRTFNEETDYSKLWFEHSHGLGVLTKNLDIFNQISQFGDPKPHIGDVVPQ